MTRNQILQEFLRKSEVVNEAEEADLLDRDEAQAMHDRYRAECEQSLASLEKQPVRP